MNLEIEEKEIKLEEYSSGFITEIEKLITFGGNNLNLTDGLMLWEACKAANAKNVVEIGSFHGGSTLVLGRYLKENYGLLYSIEPKPTDKWTFNVTTFELVNIVTLIKGKSPHIERSNLPHDLFDVAFIDGDHRTSRIIADFVFIEKYVRPGGIIVFHDYCSTGAKQFIRKALDIILYDYDMKYTPDDERNNLTLWGVAEGSNRGSIAYRKKY